MFMQDAELISVVILSDVGRDSSMTEPAISSTSQIPWSSVTLGQCVIIMEFILTIRQLRLQPE
ncbi:33769_t:CDS:1, partial [Racocetra persica]